MKLTEKTLEAFNYIKENGGRVSTIELQSALGCEKIASVTGRVNSLVKKELAVRDKVKEGETEITYVVLTEAGKAFVPSDDEE